MKKLSILLLLVVLFNAFSFGQDDVSGPIVQTPVYFDVSPPLRDMVKNLPKHAETSWKDGVVKNKFNIRQRPRALMPGGMSDPNLQTVNGMLAADTTIVNFTGNTNTEGYTPPDTHGDVGPNHYFQVVNCHFSIYSKTGTLLLGPLANSSVFAGLSNNSNDGDAIVLYDEQADRWLFSQFSLPSFPAGPFYQMIAVSQTGDPTGSWYRYQYTFTNMPDYPKFGVWGDGYYMSLHQFTASSLNYAGCGAVAYNRALMLAGSPAATMIMFTKPSSDEAFGWLPSDCDGPFPSGNPPNYFLYSYDGSSNDHLGIYEFHVDWVTTANSTFTNFLSLPVNSFTTNISGITQPGTSVKLDVINDRMMYRLQYRKFSDHEAMVCNHTVDATTSIAGIRWYELRKTSGAWSIYQQGTYSLADNNSRWMGSAAMDSSGNMALGYSVSGSSLYPSIRYTGRKKNDALNQMTIAERGIVNGGGSQTEATYHRWGDYSAMSCDPVAKATFWYTTEYMATTSSTGWTTRIASFRWANTPFVSTLAATAVTGTSATLNGTVNPNGLATTYYFEWGTTTSYGNTTTTTSAGSGTSAVAVSAGLTSLTGGTPYHFRIVATNSEGTSTGNDLTFTPGAASVTTTAASNWTMNSAESGGTVSSDGGSAVTARGVCWATTANPVVTGSHTTNGSGTGTFTSSITGLSASTLYHVRAYATNGSGTYYGSDVTFTTLCGIVSTFPWNEGFENGGLIPNCWTQEQVNSSGVNWVFITGSGNSHPAAAHGGTYNACLKDVTAADNKTKLITPTLNLTLVSSPQITFWHTQALWSPDQDQLSIYYKTSAGGAWTLLTTYTTSVTNWTQRTILLPNPTADYYIAFEGNAKWGYGVCIDDVQVSTSCGTTYPVSVSIAPSANPVCAGTSVTYTATPTNGGTTPAYQWKVNGANVSGATNATYTFVPGNSNTVSCILTSNATCVTGNPATSNTVTMTVNALQTAGVSIAASANPVCAGTSVTYTATPTNGGTPPVYQWKVNNANVSGATNATYSFVPSNSNTVSCILTSNATCVTGNPASSNTVTMTVNPFMTAGVTIIPSANPVCAGTSVTYTAEPDNGGASPVYQWLVDGTAAGTNNASFSYVPLPGDEVSCVMTSNASCITGNPATSNTVVVTVNPFLPVSVSIIASANPVDEGNPVTFTATPGNGGTTPAYQWQVNGMGAGDNSETFTYLPVTGDQVSCMLTSGESCVTGNPATSNVITMTVNSVPAIQSLNNLTITGSACFDAMQTILVAGNSTTFIVQDGGEAVMVAGWNILYYPGTLVEQGGAMKGYISADEPWCPPPAKVTVTSGTDQALPVMGQQFYNIYPNPTTGTFMLDFNRPGADGKCLVEIYSMKGERLLSAEMTGERMDEFSLTGRPSGIYLVRVIGEMSTGTSRLIKQ